MKKLYFLALLLLSGPSMADVSGSLLIEEPFARSAFKEQRNSAIFMQITNKGTDAAITNAMSEAAKIVELHTHINDNGVMRMRKADKIDLPSGQKVMLKPGGFHVMLIGLQRDLNEGETVGLTLQMDDGSQKSLTVPVHKVMMKKGMHSEHKNMKMH